VNNDSTSRLSDRAMISAWMIDGSCRPLTMRLVALRLRPVSAASAASAIPDSDNA
jgi:hypothetical protein